jgi:hypothetical protein
MSARARDLSPEQLSARTLARERRDALRRRTRRIRRTVAGLATSLFCAAFLGIYVQLASGHDPALSSHPDRTTASTKAAAGATRSKSAGSTGSSAGTESSTESNSAESSGTEGSESRSTESSGTESSGTESGSTESSGTESSGTESGSTESSGSEQSSGSASAVTTSQS